MPVTAVGAPAVIRTAMLESAAVMERLNKICARQLNGPESEANRQIQYMNLIVSIPLCICNRFIEMKRLYTTTNNSCKSKTG